MFTGGLGVCNEVSILRKFYKLEVINAKISKIGTEDCRTAEVGFLFLLLQF